MSADWNNPKTKAVIDQMIADGLLPEPAPTPAQPALDAMMEGVTAGERKFSPPYLLRRKGDWFVLEAHGMPVASYNVKRWGSEEACFDAAWKRAYVDDLDNPDDTIRALAAEVRAQRETIAGLEDAVAYLEARVGRLMDGIHAVQKLPATRFSRRGKADLFVRHSEVMDTFSAALSGDTP